MTSCPSLRLLLIASLLLGLAGEARSELLLRSESAHGLQLTWRPGDEGERHRVAVPVAAAARLRLAGVEGPLPAGIRLEPSERFRRLEQVMLVLDPDTAESPVELELIYGTPVDLAVEAPGSRRSLATGLFLNPRTVSALEAGQAVDRRTWPAPRPGLRPSPLRARTDATRVASTAVPRRSGERRFLGSPDTPRAEGDLTEGRVQFRVDRGVQDDGRLQQDRDGLYRVTHDDLVAAGITLSAIPVDELRLSGRGVGDLLEEVAISVHDADGNGVFGPGDHFDFFGIALIGEEVAEIGAFQGHDRGDVNSYFLDSGPCPDGASCRVTSRPAPPDAGWTDSTDALSTVRSEIDNWFLANTRTGEHALDHFYWCPSLVQGGLEQREERVTLPGLALGSTRTPVVRLRLLTKGLAEDGEIDHGARVLVNDVEVSNEIADGPQQVDHVSSGLTTAMLTNPLRVGLELEDVGAGFQRVEMNWIEVDYPRTLNLVDGQLTFWHEPGSNVSVRLPGGTDEVVVYDVTDPQQPERLDEVLVSGSRARFAIQEGAEPGERRIVVAAFGDGVTRVAPQSIRWLPDSGLRDETLAVDLLVIGPAAWVDAPSTALTDYLSHREAQGLRTLLVSTETARDEFGDGWPGPEGVRALLAESLATWAEPPSFVLLLGDTSADQNNRLGGEVRLPTNCDDPTVDDTCGFWETEHVLHVPTWLEDNPIDTIFLGYFASDTRTMATGGGLLPNFAAGRLPVRSSEELDATLTKILDYEALSDATPTWADRFFFVADEIQDGNPIEERFESEPEAVIAAHVEPYYRVRRFYHDSMPASELTPALIDDWNGIESAPGAGAGASILTYIGHGNGNAWSADALLTNRSLGDCRDDTVDLVGSQSLPFILNIGCISGAFQSPNDRSLLEDLVRMPDGGAIAAFGPTGTTDATAIRSIIRPLFERITGRLGRGVRLGEAVYGLQVGLESVRLFEDLQSNILLGDPTLELVVPFGPPATDLTATSGDARVDLEWPAVDGALEYQVYRSIDGPGGPWVPLGPPVMSTTLEDLAVANGSDYHYVMEPLSAEGWPGRWSPVVLAHPCTTLAPLPPSDFNIGPFGEDLFLTWTASPDPDYDRHRLTVRFGGPEGGIIQEIEGRSTFYILMDVAPCTPLHFELTALNSCDAISSSVVTTHVVEPCPRVADAPATVRDLRLRRDGTDLVLTWGAITTTVLGDLLVPTGYDVHRGVQADFEAVGLPPVTTVAGLEHRQPEDPAAALEFFLVAAEGPTGRVGALGHELPQGVDFTIEDLGGDVRLTWDPVTHDSEGIRTVIDRYEVFASATPLSRAAGDGEAAGDVTVLAGEPLEAVVTALGEYLVVAVDIHGNRSSW